MGEKTMKPLDVIGVIPARRGSKGIPGKNTVLLGGKPLVRWTIEAARGSRRLTNFLLSTDSTRIRRLGVRLGCPAPFLRPAYLATDRAGTLDVVRHAVRFHERRVGRPVDAVLVLQPTSPFRDSRDIDRAIELLAATPAADSVLSFQAVSHGHPNYLYRLGPRWARPLLARQSTPVTRQRLQPVFVRNGAIYLTRRSVLFSGRSLWGTRILPYLMPAGRSVNIDDLFDLRLARGLLCAHS
jgi:CMP-N,N'-diacetyllegionaminic acid synthase